MNQVKIAKNDYPIIELLKNRWSPRAFSHQAISQDDINSIFEAARWAASANNEQPWQYRYAKNGEEGFTKLWECLMPGNQPWAKNAAALVAVIARKTFEATQKDNYYALHDTGMATAQLMIQALSVGIHSHVMAGVDKTKLKETLLLTDDQIPVCMVALGYPDSPETLEEPFKTRELTERTRKQVAEFAASF